jgi:cellobiose-specific phosphotransferase system component IIB
MFFKRKKQNDKKEKIVISFTQKLGMVCLRSLEEYIEKNKIAKCYIIIPNPPHQNVIKYAQNISLLEIIVSPNLKQETEKIKKLYKDSTIEIINLEDFGEKNVMRDAI